MSTPDSGAGPMPRRTDEYPRTWVVDGANVIGAKADGWWRDRPGAAQRLVTAISAWIAGSGAGGLAREPAEWPTQVVVVLEGAARAGVPAGIVEIRQPVAGDSAPPGESAYIPARPVLVVSHAAGHGDDAIVAAARDAGPRTLVVTSDRALVARVRALGSDTRGARWLWERVERWAPRVGHTTPTAD
jgi:hypothetical protein